MGQVNTILSNLNVLLIFFSVFRVCVLLFYSLCVIIMIIIVTAMMIMMIMIMII